MMCDFHQEKSKGNAISEKLPMHSLAARFHQGVPPQPLEPKRQVPELFGSPMDLKRTSSLEK